MSVIEYGIADRLTAIREDPQRTMMSSETRLPVSAMAVEGEEGSEKAREREQRAGRPTLATIVTLPEGQATADL
jgi:hypothetical protein